jgi:hypothetical protein
MEELEPADTPRPPQPAETGDAPNTRASQPEYRPGDDLPPQAQQDGPWGEAWAQALDFTSEWPLGDAPLEQFILADQWHHLHPGDSAL